MAYVADLHLHSRFARACSKDLNIPALAKWGKIKGIELLGTGDCLHPLYQTELKSVLKELGNGLYEFKGDQGDMGTKFLLTTELACIYNQGGKNRRIHNLVFLPSLDSVFRLSEALSKKGAKLASDGRPVIGMSTIQLCDITFSIEPKSIIIPAHCVPPSTWIHTKKGIRQIADLQIGDEVYTHANRSRRVIEVLTHSYKGFLYNIKPWYFSIGTQATSEHPFYALRTSKCLTTSDRCIPSPSHKKVCKQRLFENYQPEWIMAKDLTDNDYLVFPRFQNTTQITTFPLDEFKKYKQDTNWLFTGGSRGLKFPPQVMVNKDFCRLIGYYLAEGYISDKGGVSFAFHKNEVEYINDVINLMEKVFGLLHHRIYHRKDTNGKEIIFCSMVVANFFRNLIYKQAPLRASNKTLPDWILHLPPIFQVEILRGWWRGDKGYTTSRQLMNSMKVICLRLGIIPSITEDSAEKHSKRGKHNFKGRVIQAHHSVFYFNNLAFFEDIYSLLSDPAFKKQISKLSRRHGWMNEKYIYLPIRKIERSQYQGLVYNLEVDEDNSYLTEFSAVHNCWTPWFGMFGANSGFNSFEECFGEFSNHIYAAETGLSSDPGMNWRVADLDNKSIVSFSDSHSVPRIGREATIFKGDLSYNGLLSDLKNQNIVGTIEFYPEEGMYHYSGHRNCGVVYSPQDVTEKGEICPVCKKRLTIGVMQRVEELATRSEAELELEKVNGVIKSKKFPHRPGYRMLVQLEEIIAEVFSTAVRTQKVQNEYHKMVSNLDNELKILTKVPLELISMTSGEKIADGVDRVRKGKLSIKPGFDMTYGVVKIWDENEEKQATEEQISLF